MTRDDIDQRDHFWQNVDSSGLYWHHDRPDECLAHMSSGAPCHRPAQDGWCMFHFERLVEYILKRNTKGLINSARREDPDAFRFVIDSALVQDSRKVLEEANTWVYFIACDGFVKIGYSVNPESRLTQIKHGRRAASKTLAPEGIDLMNAEIVGLIPGYRQTEARLHALLRNYRAAGEWFRITPTVIQAIDCLIFNAEPPRKIEAGLRDLLSDDPGARRRWRAAA